MAFDPYVDLEDANSRKGMEFALTANKMCLKALGDPMTESTIYSRILKSLESDDRIPVVSKLGTDEDGNEILYNLWKDTKVSSDARIPHIFSPKVFLLIFFTRRIQEGFGGKRL